MGQGLLPSESERELILKLKYWAHGFTGWVDQGASVCQANLKKRAAAYLFHVCTASSSKYPLSLGSGLADLMLLETSVNPFSWIFTTF